MLTWLHNDWFISIASIFIGAAVVPGLQKAEAWIRSRRGHFTGRYTAISQIAAGPRVVAEVVRLRHVGDSIHGTIESHVEFNLGDEPQKVKRRPASYQFRGHLRERQLLLAYWSNTPGSANGGTMTMRVGDQGWTFTGKWTGLNTNGKVVSHPCIWIRDGRAGLPLDPDKHHAHTGEELAVQANELLQRIPNPLRAVGRADKASAINHGDQLAGAKMVDTYYGHTAE